MRYTITYRGVPVGRADLNLGPELVVAEVTPLRAYDAIRPDVRAATVALHRAGFLAAAPQRDVSAAPHMLVGALGRGAEIGRELELRDDCGAAVAADFVELMDFTPMVTAWARARQAPASVSAREGPRRADAAERSQSTA